MSAEESIAIIKALGSRHTSVTPAPLTPVYLCAWQRRLIARVEELLDGRKSAMLLVRIDGPAMTFWRILPDGRIELE